MRIVDLTQPWGDRMPTWPQFASIEVTDITTHHRDRKSTVLVKTNMHTGTHIDAPIHYSETGKHLGEIPLADLVGTGLVLDLRSITRPWSYYSLEDVLGCVPTGEEIREGDVVVLYTAGISTTGPNPRATTSCISIGIRAQARGDRLSDRRKEDQVARRRPGVDGPLAVRARPLDAAGSGARVRADDRTTDRGDAARARLRIRALSHRAQQRVHARKSRRRACRSGR